MHEFKFCLETEPEFVPRWQEDKRVAAFVTDNAANQKKAFRATEGSGWTWFGCACHNLNLVVKNALDVRTAQDHGLKRLAIQIATARGLIEGLGEMRVHPAFGSPEVVELIDSLNPTIMRRLVAVLTPLGIATEKLSGQK
ncbi:hypothetical protein FJT64_004786 [Amphibalanus amphitrite]|uniref:DUF659 domain-containing protein n=1 Tax=Amphibalanus amphitrite TaxID=1232801 RepID=A0A6A4VSQ6_AMPAM|nr:hypothetical protein FJT64_004786 [Amphibalanus amphitrite]